jgi:hypothetical protein
MKFRVIWNSDAEGDLASAWMAAAERAAITDAAGRLDAALAEHGDTLGESRSGNTRIAFSPPLGILFEVSPEEQAVYVMGLWTFRRHGRSA